MRPLMYILVSLCFETFQGVFLSGVFPSCSINADKVSRAVNICNETLKCNKIMSDNGRTGRREV